MAKLDLTTLTTRALSDLYHSLEGVTPVNKFKDKAAAIKVLEGALKAAKKIVVKGDDGPLVLDRPTKGPQPDAAPKVDKMALVITVHERRPAKLRTKRNPYEIYQDGMTVGEALEAGVLKRDLWWDVKTKAISLSAKQ